MALYAIGDVQGCDAELGELLGDLHFSADRDQLWFVGDLVNRGPDSLKVLRRIRSLGAAATVTLGNHDLHLLAVAEGCASLRRSDTLAQVLEAPDRDVLLDWLITRPLMHVDAALNLAMLHAGLAPEWDIATAAACARELEDSLRRNPRALFETLYGDQPDRWDPALQGADRLRFITNCFTRLRCLDADGRLALRAKQSPKKAAAAGLVPWFEARCARWRGTRIVFGHWSTLGFHSTDDVVGLDTGCVWGGSLSALRLDVPHAKLVAIQCADVAAD
ncbi:MAG: symmetrical bis(5'-nucleosyl)-tetraphosphatase [Steroidobacterales bacterium]